MNRRNFIQALGASALVTTSFGNAIARETSISVPTGGVDGRVVIVGGGMAGATAAKFLRLWGGSNLNVTLVERDTRYVSNIMSNLVLNGSRTIDGLTFDYSNLASRYGVSRVQGEASDIDIGGNRISINNGSSLEYDRLIIAPGIEFDPIAGLESADPLLFPHAWKAGEQTSALRSQIDAMQDGEVFILTIPAAPFRCPPGPYERACLVADHLKRTGRAKAKVIVLDANPGIIAERENFGRAFQGIHADVIEYIPNATVQRIDPATRTVYTTMGDFAGHVINPIPNQRAGSVLAGAGLLNHGGGKWAGVDVRSYQSSVSGASNVHIIGDAHGSNQPKAGHIANTEAKVCADAVVRLLGGHDLHPAPVTNSACYTPITATTASWLTAVFAYDATTGSMKVTSSGEAPRPSAENFREMEKWFSQLMLDSFA